LNCLLEYIRKEALEGEEEGSSILVHLTLKLILLYIDFAVLGSLRCSIL